MTKEDIVLAIMSGGLGLLWMCTLESILLNCYAILGLFLSKIILTEPSFFLLVRWPFYMLEIGLRLSGNVYWSAWYWLPLDIWPDYHSSGNCTTFSALRWMKIMKNSTARTFAIIGIASYYLLAEHYDVICIYYTVVMIFLVGTYFSPFKPKIDVQVGTIRIEDISNAFNQSKELSGQMMRGLASSFFNEEELKQMTDLMTELDEEQNNFMTQMMQMFLPHTENKEASKELTEGIPPEEEPYFLDDETEYSIADLDMD